METTISLPKLIAGYSGSGLSQGAGRKAYGPSSSDQLSLGPRQTEALLPTELAPADTEGDKQEVSSNKQEQSRLVEDTRQKAEKANAYMQMADTHLEFKVSEQTGRVVISVINSDTQQVVRQIPPESLNRFSEQMTQMRGLLFEARG